MRYPRRWQLVFVCLLALALLPFAPARRGTAQAPGYTVTDLGALGTGNVSRAFGLNECGRVVGESTLTAANNTDTHPFFWNDANGNGASDPGEMQDLGTLGGDSSGTAVAVNQGGAVVGSSFNSGGADHAFYKPAGGAMTDLGSLGGSTVDAADVNASGQVVGQSEDGNLQDRAFIWQSGVGMRALTTSGCPPGGTCPEWGTPVRALGINDAGQIVGTASVSGVVEYHAYLTIGGVAVDLGTLGGTISFANKVNDLGEVAGQSYITAATTFHAFRWKDANGNHQSDPGEMHDLGTLGGRHSYAYDLNNNGLVVGRSEVTVGSSATHAFIWSSADGVLRDLNTVVTGTGWTFQDARGVNDRGQIVGTGLNPGGKVHAFLLTPTNVGPSPCAATPTPTPTPTPAPMPGTLQFAAPTYTVGEGAGSVVISVGRTGGSDGTVTVNYATSNGTATAGSTADYLPTTGMLTFGPGETTKTFGVTINQDTLDEADETVNLTLSTATGGATLGAQSTAVLTIADDDAQPTLQFSSPTYSVAENVGAGTATITVTRTGGTNGGVTVNYATSTGGTATAGSDYTAITSGTLTFAEGEMSKPFTVAILNDTLDEPDETVNLSLSGPGGGALGTQTTAVLTINDDDDAPSLSIADLTVAEGQGTANLNVTLSAPSGKTVTVSYSTADGSAVAPGDYTAVSSNTVTFNPGETSKPAAVTIANDTLDESDETFNVNLSGPTNATISDGAAVGTITDDDAAPTVSIGDVAVTEGNAGTTNATFNVTLSSPSGLTVSVNYATADGSASQSSDYVAKSGTLTFNPGETSKPVTVAVVGDTLDEPNETFNVNLSGASNATIDDGTGVGTINDDDGPPSLSINDVTVTEGDSGDSAATFTVTLSPASGQTVTVNYASVDGTANAGPDYGSTAGQLTFNPGETTKTITVNAFGDTFNEPNETFFVNLSGATNATIADAQGQGTISNDDTPALRFSQAAYPVGESAHFVTVTVTRAGDPAPAVGVSFNTSDGMATERRDYTAVSGRLQFAAGETSKTFDVLLTEDAYAEPEETINLTLSNPTGGAGLGSQATATVNIADTPPLASNPIDVSSDFVRQHYHDFLNREPDASGLAFWTGEIEQCGADAGCREVKRVNVSAAFFLSIEFQQTGYLVYRTYKAAYGDATSPNVDGTVPVVRLQEFLPDTRSIGQGVQVGIGNWEQQLEANKNAYMDEFVTRQRFIDAFPVSMTAAQFVDRLNQNAGGVLTQAERDSLVGDLSNGVKTRARVLRAVSENGALQQNELRRAFVLMQFYGYLRRNPDDPQDVDFRGWKFWLDKLNDFNGNYVQAEMVKAFLDSIEYRTRFAP